MNEHVRKPTRYRLGETPNLLDLLITNEEGMVPLIGHHPGLGRSDHDCLLFDLKCSKYISMNPTITCNFYKGNYINIKGILADMDWESILNGDLNDSHAIFSNIINKAIKENIPLRSGIPKTKNIFMCREVLKLKNAKRKLWKKYCRDKLRSTTRDLRVQYEVDLTNHIKDTPKAFWKYVKTRTIIPTLTLNDGSTAKTSLDKAEALNNYFGSVQIDEDHQCSLMRGKILGYSTI